MALPPDIAGKLSQPLPIILSYLENLTRQLSLGTADAAGDSETVGETFGTIVGARRNFKPFLVGLIPPDVSVDFVPVERVFTELGEAPLAGTGSGPGEFATTKTFIGSGNKGELPRVNAKVTIAELRQKIFEQYQRQTGVAPREETLNLIAAHIMTENGRIAGRDSFNTTCYNLGLSHASGQGTYAPGSDTFAARKGKDPRDGVATAPPTPSGGTYYFGTDYDGKKKPYPVYFTAFENLDAAVAYQVNLIARGYPNAANATTVDGFIDGLLRQPGRAPYFEAPEAYYKRGLTGQYEQLVKDIQAGKHGGVLGEQAAQQPQTVPDEPNNRFIMGLGDTTEFETDPAGDRVGRQIRPDEDRLEVAAVQTAALRQQIDLIRRTPALLMLVNPSEFRRGYEQSADSGAKGRYRNIVQTWLEKPIRITGSGFTAGQYVVSLDGDGGLTNELRVFSASYQNLLSLLMIYKTNGIIYAGEESDRGVPIVCYSAFIYYDNHIYIGSFDSFEIQDSADRPHNMSYSYQFNVRYDMPVGNDGRLTDFEVGVVSDRITAAPGSLSRI